MKFTVFGVFICSKKLVDEFFGDKNSSATFVELRLNIDVLFFGVDVLGLRVYFFYVIINLS